MPIPLETAQEHHPVELTRQASPESPLMQGDFTLDELREKFGSPDMAEEAVLAAAGNLGHAFFKIGAIYRSFAPVKGETAILSPSQESGVAIPVEVLGDDDEEEADGDDMLVDPEAEEEEEGEDGLDF